MPASPADLTDEHLLLLAGDVVGAIVDRPGDPPDLRELRRREAWCQVHAFDARTPLEAVLAARAVLYQSLALDAVLDASRATTPEEARRHRQQAIALGRLQLSFAREISRGRAAAGKAAEQAAARAGSAAAATPKATYAPGPGHAVAAKDPSRTDPPARTAPEAQAPAAPHGAVPPRADAPTASPLAGPGSPVAPRSTPPADAPAPPNAAAPTASPPAGSAAPAAAPASAAHAPAAHAKATPTVAAPPHARSPAASPPAATPNPPRRDSGQPAAHPGARTPELAET